MRFHLSAITGQRMQDGNTSAPDDVVASFALPTSSTGGQGRGITVESAALVWNAGSIRRRRAFDDIAAIQLELDAGAEDPFARCDMLFADNERLRILIELNRPKDNAIYRAFVTEFFERLGPAQRQRIIFQEVPARPVEWCRSYSVSSSSSARWRAPFGVVSGGFLHEKTAGWGSRWSCCLSPCSLASCGERKPTKTFDPRAIPERCLPPAPR